MILKMMPWKPRKNILKLTAERIKELFEALEKQDIWQVFSQSFEVVEAETCD